METLVVVAHHRNQYCSRVKPHDPARFGSSPPSRNFRGVNCRSFQSGAGLLPTPFNSPIPINSSRTPRNGKPFTDEISGEGFLYPELWAGPAYSNSPPPSSLPIPTFSLWVKRTMSPDLRAADPVVDVHQTAKSAPASPTREPSPSVAELFLSADSATATKALRRILNLDNTEE
ncbi:transducin family protein [Hibiscus syriacus]|uniref:Transducin family protein n=1 Tax=Hibiscus syriacus TaxID=106335 RepID=A0A6A3BX33_HIBSY|nr:transducin family protein [Hibiscus syriacus]